MGGAMASELELGPTFDLYGDGSWLGPTVSAVATVAFDLAQRDRDSRKRTVTAPLPRWMSQPAAWAEPLTATCRGDCVGPLTLFRDLAARDSGVRVRGAGFGRAMVSVGTTTVFGAQWIQTHVVVSTVACAEKRQRLIEEHPKTLASPERRSEEGDDSSDSESEWMLPRRRPRRR